MSTSPAFVPLGFLSAYGRLGLFLCLSLGLGSFLIFLAFVRGKGRNWPQKSLGYECGLPPCEDVSPPMNIRFALVALLFILFDLEVLLILPWALSFRSLGWVGYGTVMLFLAIVSLGLVYEWRKGVLEWK